MDESCSIEAFETYAAEFKSLLDQAASCSASSSSSSSIFEQCHDLLQQMAVEARGIDDDPQRKRELLDRHRAYKSQWQAVQQTVQRQHLLASSRSSDPNNQQHQKLQHAQDTLARQNDTLAQATRTMQETEELATELTGHLAEQRDTLERTRANTQQVGTMAARANQIATNLLKPWWKKGL